MKRKAEVLEHLKQVIHEVSLGAVAVEQITGESRIIGDLGLDSMDYATVMLSTEQWAGVKIREDGLNWSRIQTVEQLADLFLAQEQA